MQEENKCLEQFERVKRWWTRFNEISKGRVHLNNTDFSNDEIYAFFLNCYHLKDWIKNDPATEHLKDIVEDFIDKSNSLSICADLCNGLKHLKRDPKRVRKNAKFGPKTHKLSLGNGPRIITISYTIVSDAGSFDAFEIASQCLVEWENFFQQYVKRAS